MSDNYCNETVPGVEYVEDSSDLHVDMAAYDRLPPRIRQQIADFPAPIETPLVLAAWLSKPNEDWLSREIAKERETYLVNAEAERNEKQIERL